MRPFSFVRKPYFEELQFLQRSFVNGARTGLLFEQERCFYKERDDFALAAAGQKTDCPASPGLGGIRLATMLAIANLANINRSRGPFGHSVGSDRIAFPQQNRLAPACRGQGSLDVNERHA